VITLFISQHVTGGQSVKSFITILVGKESLFVTQRGIRSVFKGLEGLASQ
jgi:hypothetical protein